jgi:hypothetical protein
VAGRKRKPDAKLVLALACGALPEQAAQQSGVSLRTVFRRLAEPGFRSQIVELQAEMLRRAAGMFTAATLSSVKTLTNMQQSANSESVRLGAARSIIELGCKLRESVELMERMAAVETQLASLLTTETTAGKDQVNVNSTNEGACQCFDTAFDKSRRSCSV